MLAKRVSGRAGIQSQIQCSCTPCQPAFFLLLLSAAALRLHSGGLLPDVPSLSPLGPSHMENSQRPARPMTLFAQPHSPAQR
ncbi:hypothetical protein Cadr_000023903 [Camelus dromedarius]|uniref:Uncharacterized protein n=1 Tax=Camelus dromedarius TaxID=9838 RepID=A0A5N4CW37_CAMDR|nr:hypothetical protein Cadr_000023903 [Camelus dromedarius]